MTHASEQTGRAARRRAPRSAQAQWEAAPDRADPVATLERQAETRAPELVPVRYAHRQRPAADRADRRAAGRGGRGAGPRAARGAPGQYRRSLPPDVRELAAGYQPVDLAHKVVGVGSVGLRAWIVLLLGRDDADPRFLQVKEAQPSVLEPFARRSSVRNEGQRAVRGQRLMQAAGDILPPSAPTSARATASTAPSRRSPGSTPIRTNAITRRWWPRSVPGASRRTPIADAIGWGT